MYLTLLLGGPLLIGLSAYILAQAIPALDRNATHGAGIFGMMVGAVGAFAGYLMVLLCAFGFYYNWPL